MMWNRGKPFLKKGLPPDPFPKNFKLWLLKQNIHFCGFKTLWITHVFCGVKTNTTHS